METKMKKILFDLERAKKGEAFHTDIDTFPSFYIAHYEDMVWSKFTRKGKTVTYLEVPNDKWHHLIPDEPKLERWAVVSKKSIYDDFNLAIEALKSLNTNYNYNYTVVKLADEI
jgi:hypothetical protein